MALTRFRAGLPERLFSAEFERALTDWFGGGEGEGGERSAIWSPPVDLAETEEGYTLEIDLPGVSKDDVSVDVENDRLSISGERRTGDIEEDRNYIRIERSYGRFYRSFALPAQADSENITCSFTDGQLSIRIPRTQMGGKRQIEIS